MLCGSHLPCVKVSLISWELLHANDEWSVKDNDSEKKYEL